MPERLTIPFSVILDANGRVILSSNAPELGESVDISLPVPFGTAAEKALRKAAKATGSVAPPDVVRVHALEWTAVAATTPHVFLFGNARGVDRGLAAFEDHFEIEPAADFVYVENLRALVEVLERMKGMNRRLRLDPDAPESTEKVFVVVMLAKVLAKSSIEEAGPALKMLLGQARSRAAPWSVVVTLAGSTPDAAGVKLGLMPVTRKVAALGEDVPWTEVASVLRIPDDEVAVDGDRWVYRASSGKLVFAGRGST